MKLNSAYLDRMITETYGICDMQIVMVDIVKYSERKNIMQVNVINQFTRLMNMAIDEVAKNWIADLSRKDIIFSRDVIKLPTGDGVAICMPFHWLHGLHLEMAHQVLRAIENYSKEHPCGDFEKHGWCDCHDTFKVRIGIASGKVILYKDLNDYYSVAGDPINMAARVMDLGEGGHVLLTQNAYYDYKHLSPNKISDNFRVYPEVTVKHGKVVDVYQYVDSSYSFLNKNEMKAPILSDSKRADKSKVLPSESTKTEKRKPADTVLPKSSMDLLLIESGEYFRISDTRNIQIPQPFGISKKLITQSEFDGILQLNPSFNKGENLPVEKVSFYDAVKFCNELSKIDGYDQAYKVSDKGIVSWNQNAKGYRLPFEAEWEYCLRYSLTDIENTLNDIAWYSENSGGVSQQVGKKEPNEIGIFDMLGNVWEWCYDSFSEIPEYSDGDYPKFEIPESTLKVLRGGSFADFRSQFTRGGFRKKLRAESKSKFCGFRVVLQNIK